MGILHRNTGDNRLAMTGGSSDQPGDLEKVLLCHSGSTRCLSLTACSGSADNTASLLRQTPVKFISARPVTHLLRVKLLLHLAMALVVAFGLSISVLGLPYPDRRLPLLKPLPKNPKRAFATLHSDSNPCYDMVLLVCLRTWQATMSKYPMLVLHSVPLPPRVKDLIDSQHPLFDKSNSKAMAGRIVAISIPALRNVFVVKDRVRSAAAKFAAWDQTEYDQIAYYDSDFVFYENGDAFFDAPVDGTGDNYLYALPYTKYWDRGVKVFNSGNFLLRPSRDVYRKILELFQRRFWLLSFHQFFKTADQGFLNKVFPLGSWGVLQADKINPQGVRHIKFWLSLSGETKFNVTPQEQARAQQLSKDLNLQPDVDACLNHKRYSN